MSKSLRLLKEFLRLADHGHARLPDNLAIMLFGARCGDYKAALPMSEGKSWNSVFPGTPNALRPKKLGPWVPYEVRLHAENTASKKTVQGSAFRIKHTLSEKHFFMRHHVRPSMRDCLAIFEDDLFTMRGICFPYLWASRVMWIAHWCSLEAYVPVA